MNNTRLWTKDFIIVSAINFLLTSVFYLLIVIIAAYAVNEFQASSSISGLVSGIFIIGALAGRFFIGRYIDTVGWRRTLFIGLILFVVMTILYLLSSNVVFLLLVRFVHGVAHGVASTATGAIVAQIIPTARKGEGIGYYSMSATLAAAMGPFLGLYLSQNASYQMIFFFCIAIGILSLITALFVHVEEPEATEKVINEKGFKISNYIEPRAFPIAVIVLIVAFCYSSVLSFINFYAEDINLVETASFFFLVYSISILFSRPFTGRLMDVKGANYVMYPAFIIFTAGMIVLSTADTSFALLLSGGLIGLGFGNMQSCTQAIAVKLTPPHRLGLATSTFFVFLDAGLGFGPYVLGFVIPLIGFSALYMILGCIILATSILYYFLYGRKERANMYA